VKVLGTFAPEERKFHRGDKFQGTNVPRNKFYGMKVLCVDFSLPGTEVLGNVKSTCPCNSSVGGEYRSTYFHQLIVVVSSWNVCSYVVPALKMSTL